MTPLTRAHPAQNKSDDNGIITTIIGIIIMVVGFYFVTYQIPAITSGLQSQSWKTTTATVLSSRWLTHHATGDEYNQTYEGKGYMHTPEIAYSYTVKGRKFSDTGRRYVNDIRSIVARYPVGRIVRVTYNPSDPSQSVLEPGVNGMSWFMLAVGLGMIALGVVFGSNIGWKLFKFKP
jgi:predicted phage tail protein